MSCTTGPCPKCGLPTMYDDREPTMCHDCHQKAVRKWKDERAIYAVRHSQETGNRKQRRAAKSGRKAK